MENFYSRIGGELKFSRVADASIYVKAPSDWFVLLTDVQGSTKAIESGSYKAVNSVGAATIISIINACKPWDLPYVFGGDGATILVPPQLISAAKTAALGAKNMAASQFDLSLRVGCVPISEIERRGNYVKVAKIATSENIFQAAFSGHGLEVAESLIKNPDPLNPYIVRSEGREVGNYSGLECRWNPVKSRNGEVISVLIKSVSDNPKVSVKTYTEILSKIEDIFGLGQAANPIRKEGLTTSISPKVLSVETAIQKVGVSKFAQLTYLATITFFGIIWRYIFTKGITVAGTNWGKYQTDVALNSDFRKFDDSLKMVLDASPHQKSKLETYLEMLHKAGLIVYGLHSSSEALITCLIFDRHENHIHFVDGNDGGYALAARDLKAQLKKKAFASAI